MPSPLTCRCQMFGLKGALEILVIRALTSSGKFPICLKKASMLASIVQLNLIDDEFFAQCLESLGIKTANEILGASPKDLRSATYTNASGATKSISVRLVNKIIVFRAFVARRNSSGEVNERIRNDFQKVMKSHLENVTNCMIIRSRCQCHVNLCSPMVGKDSRC
jgi:hypothetical protein